MKDLIEERLLSFENEIKSLKTSSVPKAYISDKDTLVITTLNDTKSYYFGIEEDSFLLMDQIAIPLAKGSKLREGFNYM